MKIGFCGTQSVGKTTLVKSLKKENILKDYNFFTERSKELMVEGVPLNKESTYKGQQIFLSERFKELEYEYMITDRTIIDVLSFTEASEHISNEDKETLKNMASVMIRGYDLIIYVPITIEMEDNGVRETDEEYRLLIDKIIKTEFDDYKGNKYILKSKGSVKEKIDEIREVIKNVINS